MRYISITPPHPSLNSPPDSSSLSWESFAHTFSQLRQSDPSIRALLVIRHGCVLRDARGKTLPDASLSQLGINQVIQTSKILSQHFARGLPKPGLLFTSPMRRTVETCEQLWKSWNVPCLANELWRTRKNVFKQRTWRRKPTRELRERFPDLELSGVVDEEIDGFLEEEQVERESDEQLDKRITRALDSIFDQTRKVESQFGRQKENVKQNFGLPLSLACIGVACHRNTFRSLRRILQIPEPVGDVPTASAALFVIKPIPEEEDGSDNDEVKVELEQVKEDEVRLEVKVGSKLDYGSIVERSSRVLEKDEMVWTTNEEVEVESD